MILRRTVSAVSILSLLMLSFSFVPVAKADPTLVTIIPVGYIPRGVAYDAGKGEVFVTNQGSNTVGVISDITPNLVATVDVGAQPAGVAYDSGKGEVFVTNSQSDNVSVISDLTNTVVATIKGSFGNPYGPIGVAYDSGTGEIFVANNACYNGVPCHLNVISDVSNTVVATINTATFSSPNFVAYDSGTGQIYVTMGCSGCPSNIVAAVSDVTNSVVATINVGANPEGVAYDSGRGEVFVANHDSNSVTVISDRTYAVVATISVGVGVNPYGVAYDSGTGQVFVTNEGSNSVSVISDETNTVTATVSLGNQYPSPHGVAYDSGKGWIFAATGPGGLGSVTVLSDGTKSPNFSLSPNPSTLSITTGSSSSSMITVTAVNGFTGAVALSQNGGTSCSLSGASVTLTTSTSSGSVTLTCTYGTAGNNGVVVTGRSGSLTQTATVTYNISAAPDFTLSASPTSVTGPAGSAETSMITVNDQNSFTGPVALTSSISTAGLTCSLTPTSVSLGTSESSTLSCNGSAGAYTVTVTGTSGSLSHTTTVSVTMNSPSNVAQAPSTIFGLSIVVFIGLVGGVSVISIVLGITGYFFRRSKRARASPSRDKTTPR